MVDTAAALIYVVSLSGLGTVIYRRLFKLKSDFFSSFFPGCGLAIMVLFVLGLLNLLTRPILIGFGAALSLFALEGWRALRRYKFAAENLPWYLLILSIVLIIMGGLASLSPPVKNDTLFYHLGLPRLWIADRAINFYPTNPMSATALNSELLVTPLVGLISAESAQFAVFCFAIFLIFLTVELSRRTLPGGHALMIPMMLAVPFLVSGLADSKSDYLAAGFSLAGFIMFFEYRKSNRLAALLLSGILAGLAAGSKVNSLIFAAALAVIVVAGVRKTRHLMLFFAMLVLFAAPWYVRSAIITGNPIFPHFDNLFHSEFWKSQFDTFNAAIMPKTESRTILNFITAPFRLVYFPDIFRGRTGPLPFVLLPLLIFYRKTPKAVTIGLWLAAIYFLLWYFGLANTRYLLPVIPLLILAAVHAIDKLGRSSNFGRYLVYAAAALLLLINAAQSIRDNRLRITAAIGIIDRDQFLDRYAALDPNEVESSEAKKAFPYIRAWRYINADLPVEALVGILCSNWTRADGYYLERKFVYLNPSEQTTVDFTKAAEIRSALKENGIDHVVIDRRVVEEFSGSGRFAGAAYGDVFREGVRALELICRTQGELLMQDGDFALYRLLNAGG